MPVNPFPKAIFFDLGDTLLRETRVDVESAITWLLRAASSSRSESAKNELLEFYSEIRRSLRAGRTEFPARSFLTLAPDWAGISGGERIEEVELEFWKQICSMEPLPRVKEVLASIRSRGIKTAVVSNFVFSSDVLRYELERNGLLDEFDLVISSADYGVQKPHPMIFQAALRRIRCVPSEAWFIGDNFEKDVVGATGVGMRAIWLTTEAAPQEMPKDGVRIESWEEFLPLLGGG